MEVHSLEEKIKLVAEAAIKAADYDLWKELYLSEEDDDDVNDFRAEIEGAALKAFIGE